MTMLIPVFDLGSDDDVAFQRRQLLEAHAASHGFEVVDNLQEVFGIGTVLCVDRTNSEPKVKEFISSTTVNRLVPKRIIRVEPVEL